MSVCFDSQPWRLLMFLYVLLKPYIKQECIRVACVPPASVAILGTVPSQGAGVSAGGLVSSQRSVCPGGCLPRGRVSA